MSFKKHGQGYFNPRTLYQIESLYAWKNGLYFPPVVVEVNPTSLCNQRCRYCYVAGRTIGKLPDNVLINLLPQLAKAGVKAVIFQGTGEPLTHKALPDSIEAGGQHNISISITTNGVFLNKEVQKRILKHLLYIKFSNLDNNSKRYAYIHGCPENQWEMMVENIKNATAFRKQHNLQIFFLATVYLTKENFNEAYNIIKFCKKLGIDYISIQEAVYNEFSYAGQQPLASSFFTKKEIDKMKKQVLSLIDDDFFVRIRFPVQDETFINGRFKDCWLNNWCQGIKFGTLINSDGEVYACDRYWGMKDFSYGNIQEKSFEEIWKGKKRKKIEKFTNTTPPKDDQCSTCNMTKTNEILYQLQNAANNKWKDFLI